MYLAADRYERLGAENIIDTHSETALLARSAPRPGVHMPPSVIKAATDMPVGITERDGIEIAYHYDRIRTLVYLLSYHTGLGITNRQGFLPFVLETFEGREKALVSTQAIRIRNIIVGETIRLQVVVYQTESVCTDDHVTAVREVAVRLVMDTLLVDERVFGPNHRTKLMALVVDGEIDIRVRILGT